MTMTDRQAQDNKLARLERLRRKRDQAWELSGLARVGDDKAKEAEHAEQARHFSSEISKELAQR